MRYLSVLPYVLAFAAFAAPGQYFPRGSLEANGPQVKDEWFTAQLKALREPSLLALAQSPHAESYRFLWIRSFHHPLAVRLDPKPDGTSLLTIKIDSGTSYPIGTLKESTTRVLTKQETQTFLLKLEQDHFWSLPNPLPARGEADGSQWVIEGVKNSQYHVVDRWTPKTGPVRELGELLAFNLGKLAIPKSEIY